MSKVFIGYQGNLPIRVESSRGIIENDLFLKCDRIEEHEGRAELVDGNILFDSDIEKIKNTINVTARITELQAYLTSTDWYAIRYADTGESIPEDVKIKRAEARAEISKLRGDA